VSMASSKTIERIPVFVLSGFLGSGKTTLLNRLLRAEPHSAVIINEFGSTPIDQELLAEHKIPLTTLSGGCLCCQVRGSLAPMLKNLRMAYDAKPDKPFSRIFIETSGVASPEPILDTLLNERWLAPRYRYQGMITTVSALAAETYLTRFPEAQAQITWADKLVLTQADLAEAEQVERVQNRLQELAPSIAHLESAQTSGLAQALLDFGGLFRPIAQPRSDDLPEHGFNSVALQLEQPVAWTRLQAVLETLLSDPQSTIVRVKGVIFTEEHDGPMAVHGIAGHLFPPAPMPLRENADNRGRLVFIAGGDIKTLAETVMNALRQ